MNTLFLNNTAFPIAFQAQPHLFTTGTLNLNDTLTFLLPPRYDDIEFHDPAEVSRRKWARSVSSSHRKYDVGSITVPGIHDAFKELQALRAEHRVSTRRERVLAKIIVDIYQVLHCAHDSSSFY
jgi:hypothetical protein